MDFENAYEEVRRIMDDTGAVAKDLADTIHAKHKTTTHPWAVVAGALSVAFAGLSTYDKDAEAMKIIGYIVNWQCRSRGFPQPFPEYPIPEHLFTRPQRPI